MAEGMALLCFHWFYLSLCLCWAETGVSFSALYTGSLWKQFVSVSCEQMGMHYFWHGEGQGDLTLHMNRHLRGLSYQNEDPKVKAEWNLPGVLCPTL